MLLIVLQVSVALNVPGGALLVDRSLTYPAGPWTVNVSVQVTNIGRYTANTTVTIAIINIAPRIVALPTLNATIHSNSTAFQTVANLTTAVWTAYSYNDLTYSIVSATTQVRIVARFMWCNFPHRFLHSLPVIIFFVPVH
jgi:hypothetical protein